jgi:hypothetical protein
MNVGIESGMLHVALGKRKESERKEVDILVPFENSGPEDRSPVTYSTKD